MLICAVHLGIARCPIWYMCTRGSQAQPLLYEYLINLAVCAVMVIQRAAVGYKKIFFGGALAPRKNNCVSHCCKLNNLLTPQDKFDMFLVKIAIHCCIDLLSIVHLPHMHFIHMHSLHSGAGMKENGHDFYLFGLWNRLLLLTPCDIMNKLLL